jgi:hypothetical protein
MTERIARPHTHTFHSTISGPSSHETNECSSIFSRNRTESSCAGSSAISRRAGGTLPTAIKATAPAAAAAEAAAAEAAAETDATEEAADEAAADPNDERGELLALRTSAAASADVAVRRTAAPVPDADADADEAAGGVAWPWPSEGGGKIESMRHTRTLASVAAVTSTR